MAKIIKVTYKDVACFKVEEGTQIQEVAKLVSDHFNYPILGAQMDNEVVGLNCAITHKCTVDFFDRSSLLGNSIYSNSVIMMMIVAVWRLFWKDAEVFVQNSIDNGVCIKFKSEKTKLTKELTKNIEQEMNKIVKENLAFTTISIRRLDAIKFFNRVHEPDKAKVLRYMTSSYVTLWRLDDYYDYFFTSLAYSTGDLPDFKLTYAGDDCFVLSIPNLYKPDVVLPYKHLPIVFDTFNHYSEWGETIGIKDTSDLNKYVTEGRAKDVIRMAEIHYEDQLRKIAHQIYDCKESSRLVLMAGPSSSGKTTSAKKLSFYLKALGLDTINISTDDYFLEIDETPKDKNGQFDFESINAIDLKLFNLQMSKLLKGEKILAPEYNFVEGKKEFKHRYLQMQKNSIIIVEGLHCLNDELTSSIPRNKKFKIFIGPFTQLNIDNHNRIHTSDTRRLRRIIRDSRTRGYGAGKTLAMWYKIREGEMKNIYPYEKDADAIMNSALVYELGVLKTYVEPLLYCVSEDDPMYPEALRLIKFLRNLLPIPSDDVPRDSVLREFIGGSGYYNE